MGMRAYTNIQNTCTTSGIDTCETQEGMTTNRSFQIDEYRLKLIDKALELNVRLFKAHGWGSSFDHSKGHVGFALGKCIWDGISSPVLRLCLHSNYSNNAPCPYSFNYHQRYLASIYTKTKTCLTASHRNIISSHAVKISNCTHAHARTRG